LTPIRAKDSRFVPFPREAVWRLIVDIEGYLGWWPQKLGLRILSSGSQIVGTELEISPASGRPFRCRVASVNPPNRMDMQYFGGFVEGTGVWLLETEGNGTRLTYSLDTRARGMLVAILGRFLNLGTLHSKQMQAVFDGLVIALQKREGGGSSTI